MRRRAPTIIIAILAGIATALGQSPAAQQQPPRDPRAGGGARTAQIGGTVVSNERPARPLALATVGILGAESGLIKVTSTDAEGRFLLSQLPAGRYLIGAFKPPYVGMVYGAKAPGRPGTAVAVADGEQRTDLILPLIRGGVITGVITDDTGMPASGIAVSAMPASGTSLQSQMMATAFLASPVSDDRGAYRISGLLPGEYVVSVARRDRVEPGVRTITDAEFDDALRLLREPAPAAGTPASGVRPVDTTVEAAARGSGSVNLSSPMPMLATMMSTAGTPLYAPIYYPGTADIGEAQPVKVAGGEERGSIDIVAPAIPTSTIEGTVRGPDGQPAPGASLRLRSGGQPELMSFMLLAMSARSPAVAKDGTFSMAGIAPGRYILEARTYAPGVNPAAIAAGAAAGFTPPRPLLFAAADVVVTSGQPLSGVELRLQSGSDVTGRIVFRATGSTPVPEATTVMVALNSAVANDPLSMISSGFSRAEADGTFSLGGVMPGRYVVAAAITQAAHLLQWMPQSVTVDGREALDLPIEIKPGENLRDVVVTLGDARQEVYGSLQDASGRPAPEFVILLFATDRAYWLPNSRRVLATRPATDGRFSFAGPLGPPPGDYFLAALTDLDPQEQYKPSVLAEIAAAAIKVSVVSGQKTQQNIQIAKGR